MERFFFSAAIACLALFCFPKAVWAQLPACKDSFPSSLLDNSSFEQYSGCGSETDNSGNPVPLEGGYIDESTYRGGITLPGWHSYDLNGGHAIFYRNFNCRYSTPESIFNQGAYDSSVAALPVVPQPLPDGNGFFEIVMNLQPRGQAYYENHSEKLYITQCLSSPLYSGQPYIFSFLAGFGKTRSKTYNQAWEPAGTLRIALFGRTDCPNFPVDQATAASSGGCLTNWPGWQLLGSIVVSGSNGWVPANFEFTPAQKITSIGFGFSCDMLPSTDYISVNYFDRFILAPKPAFAFKTITAITGNACAGNVVLKAPVHPNATYTWYHDGKQITGADSQVYKVPNQDDAQGDYVANISLPYNTCINTLPFTIHFSDIQQFKLIADTTICTASLPFQLHATFPSAKKYLWQDGTTDSMVMIDQSNNYWVEVTDDKGCTKRDTVKVTIKNCEQCELFVPSAFTPYKNGLNDLFKATPQCSSINYDSYTMKIYNRWGQPVFASNNVHTGWDGTLKNKSLPQGVYVYFIKYKYKGDKYLVKKGTVLLIR